MTDVPVPACHSWDVPTENAFRDALAAVQDWQDGRCAICGATDRKLDRDHDHITGLFRGLLCHFCNTDEGRGRPTSPWSSTYAAYRFRHPAAILGVKVAYGSLIARDIAEMQFTVYLKPAQRNWLEETLDCQIRDAKGRRIKSISGSDIIRLAIDRLRIAVEDEGLPLVAELIAAANDDAETFAGRKNRGLPKR